MNWNLEGNEMINLQALIDGMAQQWQKERSETQITLGKLIDVLKQMPKNAQVANLNNLHSYRGYYIDLAFELSEGTRPANDLLRECIDAMGRVFEGYKGGEFVMGANTPIWIADYGCTGRKLIAIGLDSELQTQEDEA